MNSPETPITDYDDHAEHLIALAERADNGDLDATLELAEIFARQFPRVRAAFTGAPPPGAIAAYLRADALLRPQASTVKKRVKLVTREKNGHRITVDRTLLQQLRRADERRAEGQ